MEKLDGLVWCIPLMVLIISGGILITVRTKGVQITKLPLALKWIFVNEKSEDGKGEVSSFGALMTAASAKTDQPVKQGLISMTGTFIDTIIICSVTGLSIVLTRAWQVEGLEGVVVTTYAFQKGLSFNENVTAFFLMICLTLFAFTTILGWNYYSERCVVYLCPNKPVASVIYRILYILAVFVGPYMTVTTVWSLADIFNGLMAIPNMIAIFALSSVVAKGTREFFVDMKKK